MPDAHVTSDADALGKRRSHRLLLQIPLRVRGRNIQKFLFNEETHTLVVNAHGGLILLEAIVRLGDPITLMNKTNGAQAQALIVFLGPSRDAKREVGFEFRKPVPKFWGVAFPPSDWTASGSTTPDA